MERTLYAKHPANVEAGTDEVKRFGKTALGSDWVPTVVNPAKDGSTMALGLFWLHILTWVVAMGLGAAVDFGVGMFMSKNDSYIACTSVGVPDNCGGNGGTGDGYDNVWASPTTITIGILGGISTIVGVLFLLASAAWFNADEYKGQPWISTVTHFLTLYGTTCTFYIFCQAAANPESGFFWLTLFACLFQLYAQVLFYCTSASLNVLALPRAFIPSLSTSIQFVSALAISSGDFHSWSGGVATDFTATQKTCAWLVPALSLGSLVVMLLVRRSTRSEGGVSDLNDYPFYRSLVLMPFLLSGLLSAYKFSFVKIDPDPTAYIFALVGMLLQFVIISVVFVPSADAAFSGDM